MCPGREPDEGVILVDRACSLPLKTVRISRNTNPQRLGRSYGQRKISER